MLKEASGSPTHHQARQKRIAKVICEMFYQRGRKVHLTTIKAGLKSREFVVALANSPLKTMAKMLLKAQKYMNVEDAIAVIGEESTPKEKESAREDRRGRKRERRDCQTSSVGNK